MCPDFMGSVVGQASFPLYVSQPLPILVGIQGWKININMRQVSFLI